MLVYPTLIILYSGEDSRICSAPNSPRHDSNQLPSSIVVPDHGASRVPLASVLSLGPGADHSSRNLVLVSAEGVTVGVPLTNARKGKR